jgi:hypothetical protein
MVGEAFSNGAMQRLTIGGSAESPLLALNADGTVERAAGNFEKRGISLWAMPVYQSQQAWGMRAGNFNSDLQADMGGIAIGADYTTPFNLRAGISFTTGAAYAQGGGSLASTENSATFWGIGGYIGFAADNALIAADINYTRVSNEVEQHLPAAGGNLKADIAGQSISTGVRGEYKIPTASVDVVPHVGIRNTYLYNEGFDAKSGKESVLVGKESQQSIWTFPIGVSVSRDIETTGGWYVKPFADLSIIPAAGDIETSTSVRFTGTDTWAKPEAAQVMDYVSYRGTLGLEVGNGFVKFGLNYGLTLSEHTTAHAGQFTARVEF